MAAVAVQGNNVVTGSVEVNDTSRVIDLDEVVVVSQPKDVFRLRQQPTHSSLFTQNELSSISVNDLAHLSDFVPSFSMPVYGSRLTSSVYMRGTGSRMNTAAPSVPIYYDNIPLVSKAAFNTHFYMLDRVDVLHGPQATLYGMNSEGGLVRIFTKNPMNYQGTDVNLGLVLRWLTTIVLWTTWLSLWLCSIMVRMALCIMMLFVSRTIR